jgi:alpha-ketoglutarate-dependent taurine dioxygenase
MRSLIHAYGECVGIVGMPEVEALPLIQELSDVATRPEFLYLHQWRVGDLLMWDNCCAQHLAVKDYELPQRRLMHRVTVNGLVPV